MCPRLGRPKIANPMTERLYVRITKSEKEDILQFSAESGLTILELIRIGIDTVKNKK